MKRSIVARVARVARVAPVAALLTAACAASLQARTPDPAPQANEKSLQPLASYEQIFQQRASFYMKQIAAEGPMKSVEWAKNAPGVTDPHKYVMPVIIAALSTNPKDENALAAYRWLMTVDKEKSDRGLYHFAAYPRTRMYFQFKDQLPADIKDAMVYDVTHFFPVLRRGGTDNHTWMHRASGYLWAEYLPEVGKQTVPAKEADGPAKTNLEWERDWLKGEVKKFYTAGQGEYDSSTYVAFSAASMSNVFDFSQDKSMRDLARAQLEWVAAAQGLKYFHGVNMGPEARGFASSASDITITDTMNWLWFGDNAAEPMAAGSKVKLSKHASTVLALSKFRPHPVIRNIATKNVKLPFESRNSKPKYYGQTNVDNKDQEYLWVDKEFAMSTLYSGDTGAEASGTILPQTTMFKIVARDAHDTLSFGAGNGYHHHVPLEGRSPFDQFHQKGAAAIDVTYVDRGILQGVKNAAKDSEVLDRSLFGYPASAADPVQKDGWYFFQVNRTFVAAKPLNGKAEPWTSAEKKPAHKYLASPGPLTGWVIQAGQAPEYADLAAFEAAVTGKTKLDLSSFEKDRTVSFTSLAGDVLKMRHTGGGKNGVKPQAWTNGQEITFAKWPVWENPYMHEEANSGILRLNDGQHSLTIDYSGQWPVFKEGAAK